MGYARSTLVRGAAIGCAALAIAIATPAAAVHDEFELDGDIADSSSNPSPDWASFFDATGAQLPLPLHFMASDFVRDFVPNATGPDFTTFTTGSKDTLPIGTGWQCARSSNVNSKVDLLNTYATFFVDPVTGDRQVYFGLERASNAGDGNVAIWFLQDGQVGCVAPSRGSGAAYFAGNHIDGDLLVVSSFTNGGTVSTVDVFKWEGGPNGQLNPTPIVSGADCKTTAVGDAVCATVNANPVTPPWATQDKDGNNVLDASEFFEGGLNVTRSAIHFECFNRVLFDTRSSQSLTATLFDYTLGSFDTCNDFNACTTDVCDPVTGCAYTPISCDDGNPCTDDSCDPASGCVHTANHVACNDGNACTTNDTCSGGACTGGAPATVPPCAIMYPFASSDPRTSMVFNESEVLRTFSPTGAVTATPGLTIKLWYNDEHALTLGVRRVSVKTKTGTAVTDYPLAALCSTPTAGCGVTNPQVGTTALDGDQAGTDTSTCAGYPDLCDRPMFPALFITDITTDPTSKAGDWQSGGTPLPPNAVFGTWKAAVRTVDKTRSPTAVTVTPDPDPAKNNWNLGEGDPVPDATLRNEGYGAEVRWNVDALIAAGQMVSGRAYRLQFMVHDGDQNKTGGDVGENCVNIRILTGSSSCP